MASSRDSGRVPPPRFYARPPRVLDDQATHRHGRDREEHGALALRDPVLVDEPEIRLVDDLRRGQRVVRLRRAQLPVGDPPEVVVDERKESVERLAVAAGGIQEQVGCLALSIHATSRTPAARMSAFRLVLHLRR